MELFVLCYRGFVFPPTSYLKFIALIINHDNNNFIFLYIKGHIILLVLWRLTFIHFSAPWKEG